MGATIILSLQVNEVIVKESGVTINVNSSPVVVEVVRTPGN